MVQIEVRERPLYEVANAYQMRTMDLLRIVRDELHIPVKSHMSVLTSGQYEEVVSFLEKHKKTTDAEQTKKKVLTRKKTTEKGAQKAAPKETEKPTDGPTKSKPPTRKRTAAEVKSATAVDVRDAMRQPDTTDVAATLSAEDATAAPRLSKKTIVRKKDDPRIKSKTQAAALEQAVGNESEGLETPSHPESEGAVVIAQPDADSLRRTRPKPQRDTHRQGATPGMEPSTSDTGLFPPKSPVRGEADIEERDTKLPKRSPKLTQKTEVFKPVDYLKREQVFRTKRKRISRSSGLMSSTTITTPAAHKRAIEFRKPIAVKDLAHQMKVKSADLLSKLRRLGSSVEDMDAKLDFETASLVVHEFNYEVKDAIFTEERYFAQLRAQVQDPQMSPRPPVVTVMGHVDHGKTSLLDCIRKTSVVKGEAGGITQHIGAYHVELGEKAITFIDTPGHAAFTAMRKRGADVTDIVVLVVAADDGVMPQTREAVEHAKAAKVPIVVAVNKMDVPGANPDKIRNQLSELGLVSEEWGGDTIFVPTSATKGEGIDKLCESLLLVAEMAELKGSKKLHPSAIVVESRLDKARGPLVTLIVTQGVFTIGADIISGTTVGRVRQLQDENSKPVKEMGPGYPVQLSGFDSVVPAGARVDVLPSAKDVQELLEYRREHLTTIATPVAEQSLEELMAKIGEAEEKKLNFIIKADVKGSEEALCGMVNSMASGDTTLKIIACGCGPVTQSDMDLAKASGALIVAFHTKMDTAIRKQIENSDITLIESDVIYELMDTITKVIESGLEPELVTEELGAAEVRQVFHMGKTGVVAGSYVSSGKITRNALVRVKRDGQELGITKVVSLKRFKDDAKEVASGYECGIGVEWHEGELQAGDVLEAYRQVERKPKL